MEKKLCKKSLYFAYEKRIFKKKIHDGELA